MKRLLLWAILAVVASGGMATSVLAGAFGLFYCPCYCDKRCGSCFVATNAFSVSAGCCPGPCAPCGGPSCPTAVPPALGACGGDCPGSFGCGGFHYRKTHSCFWNRCKGGDCAVAPAPGCVTGHGAPAVHPGPVGPAVLPSPANNVHPTAAPVNGPLAPNGAVQPVGYQGYGMYQPVPMMPTWGAYGYGYYPPMQQGYRMGY